MANQWKHHEINEEKVIQSNKQLNQYFQWQTKLQQVHLVNRKQKSMSIQVVGFISSIPLIVSIIMKNRLSIHIDGIKQHLVETIFKDFESLTHSS